LVEPVAEEKIRIGVIARVSLSEHRDRFGEIEFLHLLWSARTVRGVRNGVNPTAGKCLRQIARKRTIDARAPGP
jgi:hypothetical protein